MAGSSDIMWVTQCCDFTATTKTSRLPENIRTVDPLLEYDAPRLHRAAWRPGLNFRVKRAYLNQAHRINYKTTGTGKSFILSVISSMYYICCNGWKREQKPVWGHLFKLASNFTIDIERMGGISVSLSNSVKSDDLDNEIGEYKSSESSREKSFFLSSVLLK